MIRVAMTDRTVFDAAFGDSDAVDFDALRRLRAERQQQLEELAESYAARRISISVLERSTARIAAEVADLDEQLAAAVEVTERRFRLVSLEDVDDALGAAELTQRRQLLADLFPSIEVDAPGRGRKFTVKDHVRLTDRAGRVWPEYGEQWKRRTSLVAQLPRGR
jgi:hypothetical protein